MSDVKILVLTNGNTYISEVKDSAGKTLELINPMLMEHKYNTEQQPQFRYIPWQILTEEDTVSIDKSMIVMSAKPKTELLDVYQRICVAFIPLEPDEDEEE